VLPYGSNAMSTLAMQVAAAAEAAELAERLAEAREAEVCRLLTANAALREDLAAAKARLVGLLLTALTLFS
jgi:hypothetical protein